MTVRILQPSARATRTSAGEQDGLWLGRVACRIRRARCTLCRGSCHRSRTPSTPRITWPWAWCCNPPWRCERRQSTGRPLWNRSHQRRTVRQKSQFHDTASRTRIPTNFGREPCESAKVIATVRRSERGSLEKLSQRPAPQGGSRLHINFFFSRPVYPWLS